MLDYKKYLPIILFIFLAIVSFWIIEPLLLAVFLGILLAYLIYPFYKVVRSRVKSETLAASIVCVLTLLIIMIPAILFMDLLVKESYLIYITVKQRMATGIFSICGEGTCPLRDFFESEVVSTQVQNLLRGATNLIIEKGSNLLMGLPRLVLNLFVAFFTMFYCLKDGPETLRKYGHFIIKDIKKYAFIERRLNEITKGIVFGYFFVAVLQGILGGLGFWAVGISSPIFWGVMMTILALVPYMGTGLVWAPAAILLILDGITQHSNSVLWKGIGLLLYGLLVVSTIDNILRPRIIGRRVKVHPIVILLGILGGMFLFGPLGVIFGPFILSITVVIVEMQMAEKEVTGES